MKEGELTPPLVFQQTDGSRIKLTAAVVSRLRQHAQLTPAAAEAGGILIGRYLQDSSDVVVDDITEPLPSDKRGRYFFHREQKAHQQLLDQAWRDSGGTRTYLGEWHTHPEADPTPSCIDRMDWRRKLRQDHYFAHLFFFIVGTQQIRAWGGSRAKPKPMPLALLMPKS
ncbi:MAG TPA: Mov34/MPN/PAD-1 family protein [Hymenobacter sp.]|jgi:integrative and conjugative element protein (TIGR02256 family)